MWSDWVACECGRAIQWDGSTLKVLPACQLCKGSGRWDGVCDRCRGSGLERGGYSECPPTDDRELNAIVTGYREGQKPDRPRVRRIVQDGKIGASGQKVLVEIGRRPLGDAEG